MAAPFTLSVMSDLRPGPTTPDWHRHYGEFLDEVQALMLSAIERYGSQSPTDTTTG